MKHAPTRPGWQGRKVTATCYVNLATCHIKLGDATEAEEAATEAIKAAQKEMRTVTRIDAADVKDFKALFRRGQARLMLGSLDDARADLVEAARREPQNRDVRKELDKVKQQLAALKEQQKGLFGGMFQLS